MSSTPKNLMNLCGPGFGFTDCGTSLKTSRPTAWWSPRRAEPISPRLWFSAPKLLLLLHLMSKIRSAPTTAQSLGSLIKSARDIMRKDKGLNGDLDRLPMLTWIMFLKFLDDLEFQRETEAELAGKKFQRAIDPSYRWRDRGTKS